MWPRSSQPPPPPAPAPPPRRRTPQRTARQRWRPEQLGWALKGGRTAWPALRCRPAARPRSRSWQLRQCVRPPRCNRGGRSSRRPGRPYRRCCGRAIRWPAAGPGRCRTRIAPPAPPAPPTHLASAAAAASPASPCAGWPRPGPPASLSPSPGPIARSARRHRRSRTRCPCSSSTCAQPPCAYGGGRPMGGPRPRPRPPPRPQGRAAPPRGPPPWAPHCPPSSWAPRCCAWPPSWRAASGGWAAPAPAAHTAEHTPPGCSRGGRPCGPRRRPAGTGGRCARRRGG